VRASERSALGEKKGQAIQKKAQERECRKEGLREEKKGNRQKEREKMELSELPRQWKMANGAGGEVTPKDRLERRKGQGRG